MPLYLSVLRGINVSGQKKILMPDLKKLYEELGFKNVTTYIQSGNVMFETNAAKNLTQKIQKKIFETYHFEVPVIIRTLDELENVIAINPFLKIKNVEIERLYVTYLNETPSEENKNKIIPTQFEPEQFKIIDKEVYLYVPKNGYGNSKLNNNFFENKLKVTATTRNWKTTCELVRLMKHY